MLLPLLVIILLLPLGNSTYVLWANYREERLEKIRDGIEEVDQVL